MGLEIERKYLVTSDEWRNQAQEHVLIRQGYFLGTEKASLRIRICGATANINIKSATLGIRRSEYEYDIPLNDAQEMLDQLCDSSVIEKCRYIVPHHNHIWEVDVFSGDNQGLVVAEVELNNENEEISLPTWVGVEVSHDKKYYNVCLLKHPYINW